MSAEVTHGDIVAAISANDACMLLKLPDDLRDMLFGLLHVSDLFFLKQCCRGLYVNVKLYLKETVNWKKRKSSGVRIVSTPSAYRIQHHWYFSTSRFLTLYELDYTRSHTLDCRKHRSEFNLMPCQSLTRLSMCLHATTDVICAYICWIVHFLVCEDSTFLLYTTRDYFSLMMLQKACDMWRTAKNTKNKKHVIHSDMYNPVRILLSTAAAHNRDDVFLYLIKNACDVNNLIPVSNARERSLNTDTPALRVFNCLDKIGDHRWSTNPGTYCTEEYERCVTIACKRGSILSFQALNFTSIQVLSSHDTERIARTLFVNLMLYGRLDAVRYLTHYNPHFVAMQTSETAKYCTVMCCHSDDNIAESLFFLNDHHMLDKTGVIKNAPTQCSLIVIDRLCGIGIQFDPTTSLFQALKSHRQRLTEQMVEYWMSKGATITVAMIEYTCANMALNILKIFRRIDATCPITRKCVVTGRTPEKSREFLLYLQENMNREEWLSSDLIKGVGFWVDKNNVDEIVSWIVDSGYFK